MADQFDDKLPPSSPPPQSSQSPYPAPEDNEEKSSDSLYVQQLEFTEDAAKGWVSFFINRFRVVIMIIIGMFLWGAISLMSMPLESDPEVEIPVGVVSVGLPGASPADTEELLIKEIEPDLANISGIKTISSTASNSFATITVEFNANEDLNDAMRRLRDTVESAKGGLPDEATDPVVTQVAIEDTPVWTIIVTGPYDNFTIREYAEIVQEELETLEGTREVRISGGDLREIRISYDPQKLQTYNLSIDQINGLISATNLGMPLGSIDISNFKYTVRAEGKFNNVAELRKLPISTSDGQIIRLQDVADVVERARKKDSTSGFSIEGGEPQNAISLSVVKKVGKSIVQLIDDGKAKIEELEKNRLPADVSIESTLDFSEDIRTNITNLTRNGLATIALVVIMLFLFVGFKEAFVAGLAIPMVFATSFGIMKLMGVTLNYLSLFSLILALGLLVDNAIVVLQASKQYIRSGKFTPEEAVLLVFRDFKYTLITTTLTTVWALLPLLLSTGIVGQFIRSIPITVSATLIASLMIAFLVNHPLAAVMERVRFTRNYFKLVYTVLVIATLIVLVTLFQPGWEIIKISLLVLLGASVIFLTIYYQKTLKDKLIAEEEMQIIELADPDMIKEKMRNKYKSQQKKGLKHKFYNGFVKLDAILPTYERVIGFLLRRKIISVFVLFLILLLFVGSAALPATGVLKPEFLPPADFEYMYINIKGAPGLISDKTREVAEQVKDVLLDQKAIKNFSVVVGAAGSNVSSFSSIASGSNSNRAQFAILLFPYEERPFATEQGLDRPEKSFEFAARLRELIKPIEGAEITVQEISGGPPSGADFSVRISGDNLAELERLANKYKDALSEIPGTVNESLSIEITPGEFTFYLDYEQMQLRGLTVAQVASTLRTAINGAQVTKILGEGDDLEVIAEFKQSRIPNINSLKTLTLSNGRGQLYQLSDIANIELGSSLTSISRIDQKRFVSISSSVESPHLPAEVETAFRYYTEENPLPSGYDFSYGGVNDMTNESIMSIFNSMIVALILIVGTLLVQLNSFRKTVIVLVTIPLAATGVFYGLALIGMNLSFPVLIGVLALFGIVINNAIILVDKIGTNLRVGIPFQDAIKDGAKSRLEAIFLTSIATIIGMIPLTISDEIWGGLGASLIFGLGSAMFLTLLVVPVLYNLLLEKPSLREEKIKELRKPL
jgi:multidrug efflux pump subunit AcrB